MNDDDPATVLVVDDEPELVELFRVWLRDEYAVRTADCVENAREQLDDAVDVVLLDRGLPGLSGDAFLAEIRERDQYCRVAMITAHEPDRDVIDLGVDEYLEKPVTSTDLRETVSSLLARATYEERLQEYFSLVSMRVAIQQTAGDVPTEDVRALERRIEETKRDVDERIAAFSDRDFAAVFRSTVTDHGARVNTND